MAQAGQAYIFVSSLLIVSMAAAIPLVLTSPGAAAQSGGTQTDKVSIQGTAFVPPDIMVLKGTSVTWTNRDTIVHTVTSDAGQTDTFDSRALAPAGAPALNTFSFTFAKIGKTTYGCDVHASMHGSVTVVESFQSPFVNVTAGDTDEFSPPYVQLNATQGIIWTNSGSHQHSVTFEDAAIGDLGDLAASGGTLRSIFNETGSFRYRCKYHSTGDFETGMVGKIVVGETPVFPSVVKIEEPENATEVNGTVEVVGTVTEGPGQKPTSTVEVDLDGKGNWTRANDADIAAMASMSMLGAAQRWTYTLDTRNLTEGGHTLWARALSGEEELARTSVDFTVNNTGTQAVKETKKGGIPSPAFVLTSLMIVAAAATLARRRQD